jgi:ADP-ribose pyrophosphatase
MAVGRSIKNVAESNYMPWKKISSKLKYKNKWMKVTEDVLLNNFGQKFIFGIVHKKACAIIIPWDGKYFTLVGQYRYPVKTYSWEFPAGHLEHGSVKKTAVSELEEEAGLVADNIQKIGEYYIAPGHLTQPCQIFLATGLKEGKRKLEAAEKGMQRKKVTPKQMQKMIMDGKIKDGLTIVAFGMVMFKKLLK